MIVTGEDVAVAVRVPAAGFDGTTDPRAWAYGKLKTEARLENRPNIFKDADDA